jgi:hypothetical protein
MDKMDEQEQSLATNGTNYFVGKIAHMPGIWGKCLLAESVRRGRQIGDATRSDGLRLIWLQWRLSSVLSDRDGQTGIANYAT